MDVPELPDPGPLLGSLGPGPDGVDLPYWHGLAAGELRLQRCRACRTWCWGPQWICGRCHSFELGWSAVDPIGSVFSWTRSWRLARPEPPASPPIVTLVVELPAADRRRVAGMLVGSADVWIGMRVAGRIVQLPATSWPVLRWYRMPDQRRPQRAGTGL